MAELAPRVKADGADAAVLSISRRFFFVENRFPLFGAML